MTHLDRGLALTFKCDSPMVVQFPSVGYSHTTKQFSDTSWMSYNSAHFWHLRAQSFETAPPFPHFRRQSKSRLSPCFCLPMTPSLGLINLLKQLTEALRETFYLLAHQFIINGCNWRTTRWERCIGQGMGKGDWASIPYLRAPLSPNLHAFTNWETLQNLSFGFLWRLHCLGNSN